MKKLRVSAEARAEVADIWLYLFDKNERAADKLVEEAADLYERLCDFPDMGIRRSQLGPDYRSIPLRSYVIYYRVLEDAIEIAHVLHGARDATSLLGQEDG